MYVCIYAQTHPHIHTQGEGESLGHLVDHDTVTMVMEFFEKHQAKMAALDDHLLAIQEERGKVEERIKVLQANADKVNPKSKVVSKETVRYVFHNNVCFQF